MNTLRQGKIENPLRLLLHVPVPWVFVLTYLVGVCAEFAFPPMIHKEKYSYLFIAGVVLFAIGALIAGWSLLIFRSSKTTTVPGRTSSRLITSGAYRQCRNPMYVGLIFAYLGEAGMLRQVWPVVLLPLTVAYVNWIVIPVEEAKLVETFGEEYERYRAKVRRWI